jgi:uncharacterized membrane protein YuzA (DUF378 family)
MEEKNIFAFKCIRRVVMRDYHSGIMKGIDLLAAFVLAVGGLCWGAVGLLAFDPVEAAFGEMSPTSRLIYLLFGVAALYEILFYRVIQRRWECKPWPEEAETSPA